MATQQDETLSEETIGRNKHKATGFNTVQEKKFFDLIKDTIFHQVEYTTLTKLGFQKLEDWGLTALSA